MSERKNYVESLHRIQQGEGWHGPSLREILKGVTAEQAAARLSGMHSIWELVRHISEWEVVFQRRLEGMQLTAPEEGDFPPVKDTSPESWKRTVESLESNHQNLMDAISRLDESRLAENVAGKDYSIRFMIVGLTQHHVYHAGQILLMKKLLAPK